MKFEFNDFILYTSKRIEDLEDEIAVVTEISSNKPYKYEFKNKRREFTIFHSLCLFEKEERKHYQVISNIFDLIDLVEILKAFSSNKLSTNKEYNISDNSPLKQLKKMVI